MATETTGLLPSPPTSPPERLSAYTKIGDDPALPVALHPLTLRFSPPTAEAAWRVAHARSMQGVAKYFIGVFVVLYFPMALAEANQGAQLWLLAWSIGHLPALLLALWWSACARDDGRASGSSAPGRAVPLPPRQLVPRLLDWGALSLCVLPQLILTLRTRLFEWSGSNGEGGDDGNGNGASCLIDPLDPANGAGTFGRVAANWWFAHISLRVNCTEPSVLVLAVATSAALFTFQAPITLHPHRERLMVYKSFLAGQVSGFLLERALRCRYLSEQQSLGTQRAEATAGAAAALSEPAKCDAATVAAPSANRPSAAHESRMHPLTLRFGSAALESQYRNHLFSAIAKSMIECFAATDPAFQLVDVLGGQLKPLDALIQSVSITAPVFGRDVVHRRGNRPEEVERLRYAMLAYYLLLFPAKMLFPSAMGLGGEESSTNTVESLATCYVLLPIFLRLQGPRTSLCWLLSATVIAVSHVAPDITRGNQSSDAHALREAVVASEILAYALDWGLRAQYLRDKSRKDEERPV